MLHRAVATLTLATKPGERVVMADPVNPPPLGLTTSQAASALGVSLGTVRRWSDMGHIGAYRTPGGQRRFSEAQIGAFLRSLERGAGARTGREG